MLGSAVFRTGVAPGGALAGPWVRNPLWTAARAVPSLDLRFADNKSLVDATTGQNLVTFTRASSGTYVDSQGVIRTATTNLLLQSEDFSTTWGLSTATVSTNVDTAPNGSLTADKLIVNSGASNGYIAQSNSYTSGATYAFSVYAKAAGATDFRIVLLATSFGSSSTAQFNLSNGTVTSFGGAWSNAAISAVGNGWYRVSGIATATATASSASRFQCNATGDGSIGVLLWGAQLEQSSTVGEYIPTTSTINSAPRFDHNPTTGESLGLLVEESRTNLLLQSNGFDTTWTNTNSTETAAAGIAPDGTNTAWELKDTLDTVATAHALAQTASFTSGTSYTLSCWMKAGTLNEAGFTFPSSAFTTAINCRVNLTTGAVLFSSAAVTTSTTLFANGWVRVVATATATATATSATLNIRPMNGAASYIGTGTGTILIWGAQLEAGAFPTSYIPTTTATATRSADVASITGTNFSSWYRQDEGTVFAEFTPRTFAQACGLLSIDDGTTSERLQTRLSTNGNGAFVVADGGSVQANFTTVASTSLNTKGKLATSFAVNSFKASLNGGSVASDASGTLPTVTQAVIGNAVGAFALNGPLSRITFWPKELSESTLQGITQ